MDLLNSAFENVELISPDKELANQIANVNSESEESEQPPLTQQRQEQAPVLQTITTTERPHMMRVMTQDLGQYIRSKRDLWQILSNAQLLLPQYEMCPMGFLKAVLSG